jgi:hypothetical protein
MLTANRPEGTLMALETASGGSALPKRLAFWSMPNEKQLDDLVEADPSVLGNR